MKAVMDICFFLVDENGEKTGEFSFENESCEVAGYPKKGMSFALEFKRSKEVEGQSNSYYEEFTVSSFQSLHGKGGNDRVYITMDIERLEPISHSFIDDILADSDWVKTS